MTDALDIFVQRSPQILSTPPELLLYQAWLTEQRAKSKPRDYLFTEAQARFEPRQQDVVVPLPALSVERAKGKTCLRCKEPKATIDLPGVARREAERILGALDGRRCLVEARWEADVDERVLAQFLRPTFGLVLFAPTAVSELETRISGIEITRFPGAPYSIERPYWENMADVRKHFASGSYESVQQLVDLLRELHILALMGRSLGSFYKPASPVSDKIVAPGALYFDSTHLLEGQRGTIFLDGPRVNVSLLGGRKYHQRLCASVDDTPAMSDARKFEIEGVSWGEFVTARSAHDQQPGAWFCPPRPMRPDHWEQLHNSLRSARAAIDVSNTDRAVRSLASFHQSFVRLHPFHCANQSVAMSVVNALLGDAVGAGIPHLLLDHFALRLSEHGYAQLFARAVDAFAVEEREPTKRLACLIERNARSFALVDALKRSTSNAQADAAISADPHAARWALIQ